MAIAEDESWRIACAEYTADCVGALVERYYRYTGADDFKLPLFSELGKPKPREKTAAEIKQEILDKLDRLEPVMPEGGFRHKKKEGA